MLQPSIFAGGDAAPAGRESWALIGLDVEFATNPKRLVGAAEQAWLRLWQWCRGGGMGGRLLPDAGGVQDQCALNLDALAIMDDQAAKLQAKPKERDH